MSDQQKIQSLMTSEAADKEKAAEESRGSDENMRKLDIDRTKDYKGRKKAVERVS